MSAPKGAAEVIAALLAQAGLDLPVRLRAWDGSEAGALEPLDAPVLVGVGALGFAYAIAAVAVVTLAAWIGSGRRTTVGAFSSLPERRGPRPDHGSGRQFSKRAPSLLPSDAHLERVR